MRHTAVLVLGFVLLAVVVACGDTEHMIGLDPVRSVRDGGGERSPINSADFADQRMSGIVSKLETIASQLAQPQTGDSANRTWDLVKNIETKLHKYILDELKTHYGDSETGWWVKGVPQELRTELQQRREKDEKRLELIRQTDLIRLLEILTHKLNWSQLFQKPIGEAFASMLNSNKQISKGDFKSAFTRMNKLRNASGPHPMRMDNIE